jgi:Lon-like ATP-dependent protease
MSSSLLSLALNHPLDPAVAMTGELTVTGKVLRIGGLREKTVAARRAGAKKIIFPADNMSDWLELPEVSLPAGAAFLTLTPNPVLQNIKEGIEGHPVGWYSQVYDILFSDLDQEAASKVWQKQLAEKPSKKKGGRRDEDDE